IAAQVYAMDRVAAVPDRIVAELDGGRLDAVLFYSRRTAEAFTALLAPRLAPATQRHLGMLCMSESVAEPLIDAHFVRIGLADHPSEDGMMGLALSFARDQEAT